MIARREYSAELNMHAGSMVLVTRLSENVGGLCQGCFVAEESIVCRSLPKCGMRDFVLIEIHCHLRAG